jgi:streptogramin lyase
MRRREFVAGAAAAAVTAARASGTPRIDPNKVLLRKAGKVEIVFKSPGPQPNGLQATKDGLWVIDQGPGNRAALVTYDGKVLRDFETETERSSGITHDGEALWIGSTYSREIVRCDARTGKALERHFTPGAGVIYKMTGDPPARSSPVPQDQRQARPASGEGQGRRGQNQQQTVGGFQQGELMGSRALGTGAHGQEWRDGKLWIAVPPSREVYRIDPKTWVVENKFPTAGNRPHGIGWEGRYLWVTDSNLNAFFKHDPETGEIIEKIQLADNDPLPHGMTIWQGWMWYCDDVGIVCRLKM